MTIWPGDIVGDRFEVSHLVAFRGSEGCTSLECTRRGAHQREDGSWDPGECIGWHCPLCDAPTNSYGHHNCARAA